MDMTGMAVDINDSKDAEKLASEMLDLPDKVPFNNYVDKMRGRGSKNVCFCPRSGYKNCPRRGAGGVKKWQNSVHVVNE